MTLRGGLIKIRASTHEEYLGLVLSNVTTRAPEGLGYT